MGALGQARAMVALGQTEEAERVLLEARTKFEYETDVSTAWARLAELRGDLGLALERWTFVRWRFPQFVLGFRESARLLQATGKLVELETLLRDAAERFPSEAWPGVAPTSLADQQHD